VDDIGEAAKMLEEKGYRVDGPAYRGDTERHIVTVREPNGFLDQMVQKK